MRIHPKLGIPFQERKTGNILTVSDDLNNAAWNIKSNITVSTDIATNPNGVLTADKLIPSADSSTDHYIGHDSLTTTAALWALSGRFMASGYDYVELIIGTSGLAKYYGGYFNLRTGKIVSERMNTYTGTRQIVPIGGGWYFCKITVLTDSTSGSTVNVRVGNNATAGAEYSGNTTSGIVGSMVEFYPT